REKPQPVKSRPSLSGFNSNVRTRCAASAAESRYLMTLILQPQTTAYKKIPEGSHVGTLTKVEDLGEQPDPFKPGEKRHQLRFYWTTDEGDISEWVNFPPTATLHEKAGITKVVRALSGGLIPPGALKILDLVGKKCRLEIEHRAKKSDRFGERFPRIVAHFP